MLADYHIHTSRCGHARGDIAEYLRSAEEIGLAQIGFADHLPLLHKTDPSLSMSREELSDYVADVRDMAEIGQLPVRLGIEADFVPETVSETESILASHPFDFVLGSVHFIGEWGFDDPREMAGYEGRDPEDLYEEYFQLVIDAANSGLFDVLAHPDLIKKFDVLPRLDLRPYYEEVAEAAADNGLAIEVSTAGLRKPVGEIYPSLEFLDVCRKQGVAVMLGSDAHAPEEVGYHFDQAVDLLESVGYTKTSVFEQRQRSALPL
ncbi:MAG: histidinol-phosphatase HisJ family protein [Actinobacteria bacterium]|nr:MAG: histidinol-phosphatase HisJ family protein [Actinomycetota bacterium]